MPGNNFGKMLCLTTWGESHGEQIGGVLDGLPPGIYLDLTRIQQALSKRRPGQNSYVSQRHEDDFLHIVSGLFEGKTLGTPLAFFIHNNNQRSQDYEVFKNIFRPGHADYTYHAKYGHYDYRGGGRASARTTACLVAAGNIALQVLQTINSSLIIQSAITQFGPYKANSDDWSWEYAHTNLFHCPSPSSFLKWQEHMDALKERGLSCGAVIYVQAQGVPPGWGEPIFDKLDADIAKIMMSINAVKAVEIGLGANSSHAEISYDELVPSPSGPQFLTNYSGGILGGISTGQPIDVHVTFKPTSSTLQPRQTVNKKGAAVTLKVDGRHDPCVALRACPIVESALALVLCDHALRQRGQCG